MKLSSRVLWPAMVMIPGMFAFCPGEASEFTPWQSRERHGSIDQKVPGSLQKSLVLYYSFDRPEGAQVLDESGNRNHGRNHGATSTINERGRGELSLDGQDDHISTPGIHLESFTFSALVKIPRTNQELENRRLFLLDGDKGTYALQGNPEGAMRFVAVLHGTKADVQERDGRFESDCWTSIAVTFDGFRVQLYRNGRLTGEGSVRGDDVAGTAYLAGTDQHDGAFWHGRMDEVALFNRSLTPKEIHTLHKIAATYKGVPKTQDVVLHFSFDEDLSDMALDISGQGRNAQAYGARYEKNGRSGGAFFFDGTDDFLSTPDISLDNFTFSAFVKTSMPANKPNTNNRRLFLLHDGPRYYALQGNSAGSIGVDVTGHRGVNEYDWKFPENEWMHIAVTYERPQVKIYRDGQLTETGNVDVAGVTGTLSIGGTDKHYGRFWQGLMDEVILFNRALRESEVERLYKESSGATRVQNQLAIYPVIDPQEISTAEETPLESMRLAIEPILTGKEITEYDWREHRIKTRPGTGVQLHKKVVRKSMAFVVTANHERCYLGAFLSPTSSYLPGVPVIQTQELLNDSFQIIAGREDPRGDPRIRKILEEMGLLGKSIATAESGSGVTSESGKVSGGDEFAGSWGGLAIDRPGEGTSLDPLTMELKRSGTGGVEGTIHWLGNSRRCTLEKVQAGENRLQFEFLHRSGGRMGVTLQLKDGQLCGLAVPIPQIDGDRCDLVLEREGREGLEGFWAGLAVDKPGEGSSRDPLAIDLKRSDSGRIEGKAYGWFVSSNRGKLESMRIEGNRVEFELIHRTGDRMKVTLRLKDGKLEGEGIPDSGGDRCDIMLQRPVGSKPDGKSPFSLWPGGG